MWRDTAERVSAWVRAQRSRTNAEILLLFSWKNWWVRGILTLAMISFFFFIIYLGPMVLMMIVSAPPHESQWAGFCFRWNGQAPLAWLGLLS